MADKYIEYDPAIILVDLILLKRQAYRHLLYNCDITSCWKLVIILWLIESFRNFFLCNNSNQYVQYWKIFQSNVNGECNLYLILFNTAFALATFVFAIIFCTKVKWHLYPNNPNKCSAIQLMKALIIGGSGKLLGLLEITWGHIFLTPHYLLILGYTLLCLLTAYSGKKFYSSNASFVYITNLFNNNNKINNRTYPYIIPSFHVVSTNKLF